MTEVYSALITLGGGMGTVNACVVDSSIAPLLLGKAIIAEETHV